MCLKRLLPDLKQLSPDLKTLPPDLNLKKKYLPPRQMNLISLSESLWVGLEGAYLLLVGLKPDFERFV